MLPRFLPWRALPALTLSLLALTGCGGGPEAMMADYGARVARITEQPVTLPRATGSPYPRARDLAVEIPEIRARLLDLTDFDRCNLTHLIAERNSILGRYWPASQRLDYEFRFGHRLQRCQAWLTAQESLDEDDAALLAQVDELMTAKAQTRPAVWWMASWGSAEFSRHFSASAAMPDADTVPPLDAFAMLGALAEQTGHPPDGVSLSALEHSLNTLRSQRYGGGWVRATLQMTATLNQSADALQATDTARLCPQGRPTPRARVFETVFYRYYAGALQPYLSALHRHGDRTLDTLAPLLDAGQAIAPEAFVRYADRHLKRGPGSLWADLEAARDRHTLAWQGLLRDCGLMPDGSQRPAAAGQ